jgi:hypothetical protein
MPSILGNGRTKDIEVSRAEDERIEDLSDEGYTYTCQLMSQASRSDWSQLTLSAAVGVYRPYQYKLR